MSLPLIQQGNIPSAQRSNAAVQHFYSEHVVWYFFMLYRGHGYLLYEHMECEQLIPLKLFCTHSGFFSR